MIFIDHHNTKRTFSRQRGFTIIETLIVVFITTILLLAFFTLFEWHSSTYNYQQALVRVSGSARASLQAMDLYVRQASNVLASQNVGATVFESGTSTLVLQLPAIDNNGNTLPGKWDYAVFYTDGNKLMQRVAADSSSHRVSFERSLSDTLTGLTFTYDSSDLTQVKKVSVDIKTAQQVRAQLVKERLQQNMYLKNH